MLIHNEDVKKLIAEIPEGHKHIRTSIALDDETEITFQEATIANLVRAYIRIKTHPQIKRVRLNGKRIENRKEGYADWQLIEENDG